MFHDRVDAGRQLAPLLAEWRTEQPIVVGLPRGGVPVASEVARSLGAPLDVILVRKLGVPNQPELGMGAIGEDGVRVINDRIVKASHVTVNALAEVDRREQAELKRRATCYRAERPRIPFAGRVVIIIDDGIATGSTARAACQIARADGAKKVILAVPVAPSRLPSELRDSADVVIALSTPDPFNSIGQFYEDFRQTTDDEVVELLSG